MNTQNIDQIIDGIDNIEAEMQEQIAENSNPSKLRDISDNFEIRATNLIYELTASFDLKSNNVIKHCINSKRSALAVLVFEKLHPVELAA